MAQKKRKRSRIIAQFAMLAAVFLLMVNGFLGLLLTNQSGAALRTQISARMLDVSESAAALLDGDALRELTAEDKDTEPYQVAMDTLRAFQEHVDLSYIYGIRDEGDGTFTFTIDPTVSDPAEFGEPVQFTDALYSASQGVSAVDNTSYSDKWGRFYSAYSPVLDSSGRVAGIVGVDFDAEWYDSQINRQRLTVFGVSAVSLLIGSFVIVLATSRVRNRFRELNVEVNSLADDMAELSRELQLASGRIGRRSEPYAPQHGSGSDDALDTLNEVVSEVREEVRQYIADAHALAYTDALTGAGNRTAYFAAVDRLNRLIAENEAKFTVAVFDINGLKQVNDVHGHEQGDKLIIDAAYVLKDVFRAGKVYRIGGDEFVAVLAQDTAEAADDLFKTLEQELTVMNQHRDPPLTISKGAAAYREGDREFNEVFQRADKAMYEDKAQYYATHGDRRRR